MARPPPPLGFPKSRRVRERRDYQRIQGRGARLGGQGILVLALRQPGVPRRARLGITASRKSGNSVARNRIRRLVREAFRLNPALFPDGWDFVVIAREGGVRLTLQEMVLEFRGALTRLPTGNRPPPSGGRPPRPRRRE